jgi:hypothetical protein
MTLQTIGQNAPGLALMSTVRLVSSKLGACGPKYTLWKTMPDAWVQHDSGREDEPLIKGPTWDFLLS